MVSNEKDDNSLKENKKNIFAKIIDWCKRVRLNHSKIPKDNKKKKVVLVILLIFILLSTLFLFTNTEISLIGDFLILKINKFKYGDFSKNNYRIVEKLIFKSLMYNKLPLAKKYVIEYNNIGKINNYPKDDYISTLSVLIIVDIIYGNIDSALSTLNEVLDIYKDDTIKTNSYLLLYNNKIHNYENLIKIYSKIDKEKNFNEKVWQQLKIAYVYFLKKEYNHSEKIYLNLIQNNNISQIDKLDVYLILAEINIEKRNFIKAKYFLKKYIDLLYEISQKIENSKEFISIEEIKFNLVEIRMQEVQNKNTIEAYKNLLAKKSKFFPKVNGLNKKKQANDYILETYIMDKLGDSYLSNNKEDMAQKQYFKALKIRQKYIPAFQICSYEKLNNLGIKYKKDLFNHKIINEFAKHNINTKDFCRIEFEYL